MSGNPYAGKGLDQQTMGAFTRSLGTYDKMAQGGALAKTNLTPYMNPYTQNVVNTTMSEMNRQQQIDRNRIASEAQSQNAFGGDRFALENAGSTRDWADKKSSTLSQLYNTRYDNAVNNAQQDINTAGNAAAGLGGMANQGFNWGNDLAQQSAAAALSQQQAMQGLADSIKNQFQGFTSQGNRGLEPLMAALGSLGSNLSSSHATSKGNSNSTSIGIGGK